MKNKSLYLNLMILLLLCSPGFGQDKKKGLILNTEGAFQGYTLLAPHFSTTTFLIDMEGRVVNSWQSQYEPGHSAYLLENGHLLRAATLPKMKRLFDGGGSGGRIQEFDWDGNLVWDYEYASEKVLLHHDFERLPNGNILMIAWEKKSGKEALDAGRNPETLGRGELWADHIIEVKPTGKTSGEIVWEWHVWDHLIQEHDRTKANYGKVKDHPEKINLNPHDWSVNLSPKARDRLEGLGYLGAAKRKNRKKANPDWNHTNSIAYNAQLDQIMLSVFGFSEIWIIDHNTTTEEAKGEKGDLLYRWGNPLAYGRGKKIDQKLFVQHDAHWIDESAGKVLVFNNGRGRLTKEYSSVDELQLPINGSGGYVLEPDKAYGPKKASWSYYAPNKEDFFSGHISGAQRLPNGNTLICSGENGTVFEVTKDKQIVWKYINPVFGGKRPRVKRPPPRGPMKKRGPENCLFRAYRYGTDYPGLKGRDLKPGKTVEEIVGAASTYVVIDPVEFKKVVHLNEPVKKLASNFMFTEGPVWIPEEDCLLFSDIPANEIKRLKDNEISSFRKPSRFTNGNLLDPQGFLVSCEHGSRSVVRTLKNGEMETLAENYQGKLLNSPNDLAIRSDGMIWFTDPPYGLKGRKKEMTGNHVFCLNPATRTLKIVVSDFSMPNGACLSPDEKKLYIADSGRPRHIRVFDAAPDGSLSNGGVFCAIDTGAPDGIRCDQDGRVISSAGDGVHVFSDTGKLLGKIRVPESPANLCFGGQDGKTLFITARKSVYSVSLKVKGG